MFIPSTHVGLMEAFSLFIVRRMRDELAQLGLQPEEVGPVVRYRIAQERIRQHSEANPRSGMWSQRHPYPTKEDNEIARSTPVAAARMERAKLRIWPVIHKAWDLMLDDLALGRLSAWVCVDGAGFVRVKPQGWMLEENRQAHIMDEIWVPGEWGNATYKVVFLRSDLAGESRQDTPAGNSQPKPTKTPGRSTPRSNYAEELITRAFGQKWPAPGAYKPGVVVSMVQAQAKAGDPQVVPSRKTILTRLGWLNG